jgi:hypothetical protein
MGGSSKPQNVTQTTKTEIPEFLRPFLQTQAEVGSSALTGLQDALANGPSQQVAGFSPAQQQAQQMLTGAISNPSGVYQNSLNGLRDMSSGGWTKAMEPTFSGGLTQAINGQFVPTAATGTLAGMAQGNGQYGSVGFNEAVQASLRAAQPMVASTFSGAGSGGLKSGLAQIGMQQAASDSFARLYGDERNRQLSAAGNLGQLSLGEQGLRNQALSTLGGAMNSERSRQLAALQSAPGVGLMGIDALNNMGGQQQQQQQAVLNSLDPVLKQQILLAAAQGLPIASLLGQNSSGTQDIYRNRGVGAVGGAASGAQIGSAFGPWGTAIGAIGGGLLGAYG